jgi:redox-sensitive bicupin YhaK (pirin superfamily)
MFEISSPHPRGGFDPPKAPMSTTPRAVSSVVAARRTIEGGGFVVRRPFPTPALSDFDPFLLLDEMGPVDYAPGEAVGAPDHPHRGFETVTYLLEGEFEHEDSAGHRGKLGAGDVQWMTAGDGVVHSEMPSERIRREGGRVHGFQLWVNLRARDKRIPPRYQEIAAATIPVARTDDGRVAVRVIAGEALGVSARIDTRTPMLCFDVSIAAGGRVTLPVPEAFAAAAYVFDGAARVGAPARDLSSGDFGMLGEGGHVDVASEGGARMLVLGGVPLAEPIARYGPFVMNSEAEIREAIADLRSGRFATIAR